MSLFGKKETKKGDSYYGKGGSQEDEDFGNSFYGGDDEQQVQKKSSGHSWKPFGFKWWEWVIIVIEVILVVYTLAAFIRPALLF